MKNRAVPFLFVALFLAPCLAWAADSGARFTSVSNEVKVFPEGKEAEPTFAKVNLPLQFDDHVSTGEESSAIIAFADLSTFLIKAESEILIAAPEAKKNNFELIAGKIWVNVKKMAAGDSIEVKMNQSVTGIKGTNITCGTSPGAEDRIQCLRGEADVLIRETQERVLLAEGEEVIIRPGGRKEINAIDVSQENGKWAKELSGLGDGVSTQEIPDTINRMLDRQGRSHQTLRDQFQNLLSLPTPDQARLAEFRKEADRFLGTLAENEVLLNNFRTRLAQGSGPEPAVRQGGAPVAQIEQGLRTTKSLREDVIRMMKISVGSGNPQVDSLRSQVLTTWSEIARLISILQGNPRGLPQSYFDDALDRASNALQQFGDYQSQARALLEADPRNAYLQGFLQQIGVYDRQIRQFLRDLNIVKIDTELMRRLQEMQDKLSFQVSVLDQQAAIYEDIYSSAQLEERLRASIQLLRQFSSAQRMFQQAERLYSSTLRGGSSGKYTSAEMEEFTAIYQNLSDSYQRMTSTYEDIQQRHQELQDRLGTFLR